MGEKKEEKNDPPGHHGRLLYDKSTSQQRGTGGGGGGGGAAHTNNTVPSCPSEKPVAWERPPSSACRFFEALILPPSQHPILRLNVAKRLESTMMTEKTFDLANLATNVTPCERCMVLKEALDLFRLEVSPLYRWRSTVSVTLFPKISGEGVDPKNPRHYRRNPTDYYYYFTVLL